ncbi:MAG: mitochondrial fission ELM1 family protein [Parvularculaceae bacterium]|nr:mitochondrial fission ELM1 family protein [Parvularculaceae bacterium]
MICWTVTDGRAGIEAQALGLAEAIARRLPIGIVTKRLVVRASHRQLPRALWGDPFAALDEKSDALAAPWPDLWIGCGRLSVPFSIAVKARAPETFVVQLQNPRAPLDAFDLVVPPTHDRLSGANVFPIIGSPNRIDGATLRRPIVPGLAPLAVLIGGPNKAFALDVDDAAALAEKLTALSMPLDVTLSRRTPPDAAALLRERLGVVAARFFDPARDAPMSNPYPAMLGTARAILVTEDSVNMAAEAASTGKPVYILTLRRKPFASARKFDAFHADLKARGAAQSFDGEIAAFDYAPLDETARAADEVIRRWRR